MTWVRAVAGAAIAVVGLAGCATPEAQEQAVPKRYVEAPQISAEATTAFGQDASRRAYDETAALVLDQGMQDSLLDPQRTDVTAQDIATGITQHLTQRAGAVWTNDIDKALAGDRAAQQRVRVLRFYGLHAPELSMPAGGRSPVESQAVSGGTVNTTTDPATGAAALKVDLAHQARLQYRDGNSPYPGTVRQSLTFVVVPAAQASNAGASTTSPAPTTGSGTPGQSSWLISQYSGKTDVEFDDDDDAPTGGPSTG